MQAFSRYHLLRNGARHIEATVPGFFSNVLIPDAVKAILSGKWEELAIGHPKYVISYLRVWRRCCTRAATCHYGVHDDNTVPGITTLPSIHQYR
jgi:hypothetical protein